MEQTSELILKYPTEVFQFQEMMKKTLGVTMDLQDVHTHIPNSDSWAQIEFKNDTATDFHTLYYKSPHYPEFVELYRRFIKEYIIPLLPASEESYLVQKEPSFRIHLPNNTALGIKVEDPSDEMIGLHCDGDYNHPESEMNYILSLTGQHDTNSCYIETLPGAGDFHPIKLAYGEIQRFYGNKCRHFNKKNLTGKSRISLDFRVIPGSKYVASDSSAVHSGRKFVEGGYYMRFQRS